MTGLDFWKEFEAIVRLTQYCRAVERECYEKIPQVDKESGGACFLFDNIDKQKWYKEKKFKLHDNLFIFFSLHYTW